MGIQIMYYMSVCNLIHVRNVTTFTNCALFESKLFFPVDGAN